MSSSIAVVLVVIAGILGLTVGSFVNVVVSRVPAQGSRMRRPDSNVSMARRRPYVVATTGIAFAVVTWWGLVVYRMVSDALSPSGLAPSTSGDIMSTAEAWACGLVIVAFLYFAAMSIALALIDLETHRLPNIIVLPSYAVAGILFTAAAWLTGEWGSLLSAGVGMAGLYVFYALLRAARPGGMGGGDVKLAGVIGIYLGWLGWAAVAVGALAAFVYGGVFGIALMLLRRAGPKTALPFGPWMILGAWTGVFAGEAVGAWYANLLVGA